MTYYCSNVCSGTFISHHGVKGMHWYVRRYQPYGSGDSAKAKGKFVGTLKKAAREQAYADYESAYGRKFSRGEKSEVRRRIRPSFSKDNLEKTKKQVEARSREEERGLSKTHDSNVQRIRRDESFESLYSKNFEVRDRIARISSPLPKYLLMRRNSNAYSVGELAKAKKEAIVTTALGVSAKLVTQLPVTMITANKMAGVIVGTGATSVANKFASEHFKNKDFNDKEWSKKFAQTGSDIYNQYALEYNKTYGSEIREGQRKTMKKIA